MDLLKILRRRIENNLKAFVEQGERRDASRLQTCNLLRFFFSWQANFFLTKRNSKQFQIHNRISRNQDQQGFFGLISQHNDRLENGRGIRVEQTRSLLRAVFLRRKFIGGIWNRARIKQAGNIIDDRHFKLSQRNQRFHLPWRAAQGSRPKNIVSGNQATLIEPEL